jgi:hypothetical protein
VQIHFNAFPVVGALDDHAGTPPDGAAS